MSQRQKLRQRLVSSHEATLAFVAVLDEAQAAQTQVEEGWSGKDVLAHLAASELGHVQVIRRLLAGESTETPGFDLDAFNEREVAARRHLSWQDLVSEYKINRAATLDLLDRVGDDDWDRAGPHPGGFDTTVAGTFRVIAIHEKRHLRAWQAAIKQKGAS